MSNPDILNLDEVELPESPLAITYKGVNHPMRTLTVGDFISQARRSKQVDDAQEQNDGDAAATGIVDVVQVIRDQVAEMFPTLPVDELEQAKLWAIFNWLRETTAKMNEEGAPDAPSAEGNAETPPEETPAE